MYRVVGQAGENPIITVGPFESRNAAELAAAHLTSRGSLTMIIIENDNEDELSDEDE